MTREQFHKKWENYWYYHKWHTVAGILIFIALFTLIKQCATRVEPDLTVAVVEQNTHLTQDEADNLQSLMQKYTADVNHDGHKNVLIDQLDINQQDNPQMASGMIDKLFIDFSSGDNVIYITDAGAYNYITNQQTAVFDSLSKVIPGEPNTVKLKLSTVPAFKKALPMDADKLTLSLRTTVGTAVGAKKNKSSYDNAIKVLTSVLKSAD